MDPDGSTLPPMGRALAAVAGLLVLCFAILGVLVFVDRSEDRVAVDAVLAEDLTRAIGLADGAPDPVAVADVARFRWDELWIVEARTPRATLSRALGFEFKGDLHYDAESGDMFVFLRDGALERFADYRGRASFVGFRRPIARFDRAGAVLTVRSGVVRPATSG
jgi:hypothetical protein